MPRTPQEVNSLLDQLRAKRDDLDNEIQDIIDSKETNATQLDSEGKSDEANRERLNALRLMSIQNTLERFADKEITYSHEISYDDDGYVTGITRLSNFIEDTSYVDESGTAVTILGLRTLFANDRANINARSRLVIDNEEVG